MNKGKMYEECIMKNGGITYVNECDGNDRKCDACTVLRRKYMDRRECWFGEMNETSSETNVRPPPA